jgi:hypothetical protein
LANQVIQQESFSQEIHGSTRENEHKNQVEKKYIFHRNLPMMFSAVQLHNDKRKANDLITNASSKNKNKN